MLKVKLYLFVVFIALTGISQAQEHGTINPFSKGVYNSENYIFPRDTTLAFNIGINYDPLGLSAGANNIQYWHRPVPNNNNVFWAFTSNSNLVHGIVLASDMDGTIYQGGMRMYFNAMRIWTGSSQNTGYFELNGNNGQPTFSYFNTAGTVVSNASGVLSIQTTASTGFASMGVTGASETLTMTQNGWVQITNGTSNLFSEAGTGNGITIAADTMVVSTAGTYSVYFSASFSGTAGDVYECTLYVNGVATSEPGLHFTRATSNNDIGSAAFAGFVDLVADDGLSVWIRNTGDNDDATIIDANLKVSRK